MVINKMNNLEIGMSGLNISPEGLGCMGMSEFYGSVDNETSKEVLHLAIKLGVNFFDTADVYGYGHNEKLIGEFVSELNHRSAVIVATKCGIVRDKHDSKKRGVDNSRDYILRCCNESVARLNTNIDLYYLHRVIDDSAIMFEAMSAMATLLDEGKIKAVGLSEANADYIRAAHKCLLEITSGRHGISALQTEYSLLSREVESNGVLDACNDLGITFIAYSPMSRGLLSGELMSLDKLDKDDSRRSLPRFSNDNLKHNNQLTIAIYELSKEKNCTPGQLALAWLMNHSPSVVPIPGTKKVKYLKQNIDAININLNLEEFTRLSQLSKSFETRGGRYEESAMTSYSMNK
jgi:aryl-alcohol dehydrogenase-like predicted oxidoreductase